MPSVFNIFCGTTFSSISHSFKKQYQCLQELTKHYPNATVEEKLSWIISKQRKILRRLILLYAIQSAVIYGLKFLIQRQRPFFFLEVASKISKGPGEILDPSFPSAHGAFAFMMATVLSHWFPRYRIVFFIVAGLIGWTRIYLGLLYPTDVIAGVLLGYGITKLFLLWNGKKSTRIDKGSNLGGVR
jgi:membrane-associated phospholipid phosphatase